MSSSLPTSPLPRRRTSLPRYRTEPTPRPDPTVLHAPPQSSPFIRRLALIVPTVTIVGYYLYLSNSWRFPGAVKDIEQYRDRGRYEDPREVKRRGGIVIKPNEGKYLWDREGKRIKEEELQ
jgi:hypothetical protein